MIEKDPDPRMTTTRAILHADLSGFVWRTSMRVKNRRVYVRREGDSVFVRFARVLRGQMSTSPSHVVSRAGITVVYHDVVLSEWGWQCLAAANEHINFTKQPPKPKAE